MASRSRATFQKRQKEMKRLEKQRMKAERRAEKSMARRAARDFEDGAVAGDEFVTDSETEAADPVGAEDESAEAAPDSADEVSRS
jgi:hypothetical protein